MRDVRLRDGSAVISVLYVPCNCGRNLDDIAVYPMSPDRCYHCHISNDVPLQRKVLPIYLFQILLCDQNT